MGWHPDIKVDHNGPKNHGGYWGTRREAKENSSIARRNQAKEEIREAIVEHGEQ